MRRYYRCCRNSAQALFLLLCRGRVFGVRNVPLEGGVLLVCNHQSFFDPILATLALPRECHYMARDTLFRNRWFRKLIESLNAFPVRRGSADVGAIKQTLRRLKNGALVTVFPEATRTSDGSVRPMQPGVVLIARKAGVPLVPTLILGAYEVWPRHAAIPRPAPVIIAYGEPLRLEQMKVRTDDDCINIVRDRILEMMARYRGHPLVAGRLKPPADSEKVRR
ncbi:MAG: 1-acyl-sn-glycerol-3-phosphate acyltransferase [Planctomycetes bacterium]|nr:1-acyl-sn-glycerol-3-phosphate acyltransferase [Planctomycetota bacterium]